jgi:ABC-type hemin transport system ATPase subunit
LAGHLTIIFDVDLVVCRLHILLNADRCMLLLQGRIKASLQSKTVLTDVFLGSKA